MIKPENQEATKIMLTETLIIALFPALGYLASFAYEFGYSSFFRIPLELIRIDLAKVLFLALLFYAATCIVLVVSDFIVRLMSKVPQSIKKLLRKYIILLPVSILFGIIAFRLDWIIFGIIIATYLIFIIIDFVLPLFTQAQKKKYIEKIEAQKKVYYTKGSPILEFIGKAVGEDMVTIFLGFFYVLYFCYLLGGAEALLKEKYYIVGESPETVVVRIYGDYVISVPFDKEKKTLNEELVIRRLADSKEESLRLEKVGPFVPKNRMSEKK